MPRKGESDEIPVAEQLLADAVVLPVDSLDHFAGPVIADIFRSDDLGGGAKAAWLLFILVLPFAGVLIYLIARGTSMQERRTAEMRGHDDEVRAYIRDAAGAAGADSTANDLAKLADLREKGIISEAEFQQGKAHILA